MSKWRHERSSRLIRNLSNCEREAWKKFRLQRDSNPWPLRYRCSALPTELWSHNCWEQVNFSGSIMPLRVIQHYAKVESRWSLNFFQASLSQEMGGGWGVAASSIHYRFGHSYIKNGTLSYTASILAEDKAKTPENVPLVLVQNALFKCQLTLALLFSNIKVKNK